tara:strand:- start:88248 stop:88751 length:504 start_codon:yes stop_codon:yes gene_type:complete
LGFLRAIDKGVEKLAGWGLVVCVLTMLFLSTLVIVMRWFGVTFLWFDPFIRHVVFISTFLGGVIATGRGTHIGIDILGKYLESKNLEGAQAWIERLIAFVSAGTLVWLIQASWDFMLSELKYGKPTFFGIHSGYLTAIIPIGFALIAYRFFFLFVNSFSSKEEASNV